MNTPFPPKKKLKKKRKKPKIKYECKQEIYKRQMKKCTNEKQSVYR